MNKSPNCLKVILNGYNPASVLSTVSDYDKVFKTLTEQNDIIYNEFFNYVRQKNLPLKMILTGCITNALDYLLTTANPFVPEQSNPYFVKVVFNGIAPKNEISGRNSVEFIVPTLCSTYARQINNVTYAQQWPVTVQYTQLPKSNKNIGIELNDYSIFTTPINIQIQQSTGAVVVHDTYGGYAPNFTVEFWLFVDE